MSDLPSNRPQPPNPQDNPVEVPAVALEYVAPVTELEAYEHPPIEGHRGENPKSSAIYDAAQVSVPGGGAGKERVNEQPEGSSARMLEDKGWTKKNTSPKGSMIYNAPITKKKTERKYGREGADHQRPL